MSISIRDEVGPNVLICEKSRLQCELLSSAIQALNPGMQLSYAQTMEEADEQLSADEISVILMSSLNMPIAGDAFRPLRILHERFPDTAIVYLADTCSSNLVVQAFRAGAKGVAYRDESFATLITCIDQVRREKISAGSRELQFILEALSTAVTFQTQNASGDELLTPREQKVAMLVAEGMSNREISLSLSISEHTVKNYMFHIFDKLGISNRVELVRYAQSRAVNAA